MPAVQYPFIDIAVHERVRDGFARGEAIVLFSAGLDHVLWANGAGARLFGNAAIYDFLEEGPNGHDVTFRQVEASARQLTEDGDRRSLTIRIAQGFRRLGVQAHVERISTPAGEPAVLFSIPLCAEPLPLAERARQMLEGFDDDDTHMAVLGRDGEIVAASKGFASLGVTSHTAHMLVTMVGHHPDRLMKRPIPTGRGYLPAAIGRLSDEPGLNLLFVVEMVIGNLDPTEDFAPTPAKPAPAPLQAEPAMPAADSLDAALDAVSGIVEVEEDTEDMGEPVALAEAPVAPLTAEPETVSDAEAQPEMVESAPEVPSAAGPEVAAEVAREPVETPAPLRSFAPSENGFVFNPAARAIRFVWKIDAEGRFSDVSGEFAKAVGPHAASVRGAAFTDIAHLFQLDPDGTIAELLGKRDTWSGKTILWPVEGTSLRVPVDLAALPTYTRNREFDGFRGFGIVRPADAVPDPLELGVTLAGSAPASDWLADLAAPVEPAEPQATDEATPLPEPSAKAGLPTETEPDALLVDTVREENPEPEDDGTPETEGTEQSFMRMPWGEIPALKISETANRRQSDKVVMLEERRARGEPLTAGEQAAFREIARRLETLTQPPQDAGTEPPTEAQVETPVLEDEIQPVETIPDESMDETPVVDEETTVEPEAEIDGEAASLDALAGLVPPRSQMNEGLTPAEIDDLAVPMLIHAGDRLMHANPAFLALTGYSSLAELIEVGGLDALLQREDLGHANGGLTLLRADDELVRVTAKLQSVRWQQGHALMLALMPIDMPMPALPETGALEPAPQPDIVDEMPEAPVAAEAPKTVPSEPAVNAPEPADAEPETVLDAVEPALPAEAETEVDMDEAVPAPEEAELADILPTSQEVEPASDQLAKLKGEVEELRSVLETATDGVVILDCDHTIRSMNRSASALFNYDNAETGGKPFVMLFAHESQKSVLDYLNALSGHGVASVLNDGREVIGREASGGFIPLFMTMGRLSASDGYCAVIRDITQWKRTEDELRNAKRAAETANAHKSDFLARVSHEIRTPLNAIIGFSDMMATERFGSIGHPRYIEYANDIGRSGRHVLDIVNDLLDISKIEAGEMDLDFTSVGLNETVSEAVALVQPQANGQRVIIRTALATTVPNVVADLRSIKQIALNILSNAIRFTPSGGQIVVSTSYEANGSVVLRIRDTGVGMTRSELEQAMKPFRQVTTGTRKRGDGTGLGLPLTKAMVDANRAQFSINSAPNEGTLVEVTFPPPRVLAE